MTVFPTSYSSLDEVWENSYLSPNIQKKTKKKQPRHPVFSQEPVCENVQSSDYVYNDSDLVSFANKYYDNYQDTRMFQKPRMNDDDYPREQNPKYIEVDAEESPQRNYIQEKYEPEEPTYSHAMPKPVTQDYALQYDMASARRKPQSTIPVEFFDDKEFEKRNNNFNTFDIILYIISGIILIFMMEQFVKIGMLLS